MKKYSAFVTNKRTGEGTTLRNYEAANKSAFINDIRKNGYSVNPMYVKESEVFDYIMNHTNCNALDWKLTRKDIVLH